MAQGFTYGFRATTQERNTINRQISRMISRGYILPEDIREKITKRTLKKLPDFLYKHAVFKPFLTGASGPRTTWEISGVEGKRLEEAVNRTNRQRRAYAKRVGEDYRPLRPSSVAPGHTILAAPRKKFLQEEARKRISRFIRHSRQSIEAYYKKRARQSQAAFLAQAKDMLATFDPLKRWALYRDIRKAVRGMDYIEWSRFLRRMKADPQVVFRYYQQSTQLPEVARSVLDLLDDLGIAGTEKETAIIKRFASLYKEEELL